MRLSFAPQTVALLALFAVACSPSTPHGIQDSKEQSEKNSRIAPGRARPQSRSRNVTSNMPGPNSMKPGPRLPRSARQQAVGTHESRPGPTQTSPASKSSGDFLSLASVAVDRDLGDATQSAKSVTYDMQIPPGAPLPPHRPYQIVRRRGPGHLDVTCSRPTMPKSQLMQRPGRQVPTKLKRFLRPSGMLPFHAPLLQRLARQARAGARTNVQTAKNLTWFVFRYIIHKGYSLPAATALDVARLRRGDCSEHAVLLAALARAQGIPARLLSGLVYAGMDRRGHPRFMYHMWTEMHLSGRWIPFDATRPDPGVGPTHILLAVDSGNDILPVAATTILSRVLGVMKLRVVRIARRK